MFPTPSALAADLSQAVERHELVTFYQPQVDVASGIVVAVEALVRWEHPEYGIIPPDDFIPIAESTGSIRSVGRMVFADAVTQIRLWNSVGFTPELSVNISPTELGPGVADELVDILTRSHVDPKILTMEITESEPIVDLPRALRCLDEFRLHGIGVSVDDFGTGYSSLNQLRSLPATEVKVDQSLIRGNRDLARRALEPALSEAASLGLRLVAEGVETEDQLDHARELGCQRAQGYLIGAPMAPAEVELLFTR